MHVGARSFSTAGEETRRSYLEGTRLTSSTFRRFSTFSLPNVIFERHHKSVCATHSRPRGAARVSRAMFARLESGEAPAPAGGAPADEEVALVSPDEYDAGGRPPVPRRDGRDLADADAGGEEHSRTTSTSAFVYSRGSKRAVIDAVRPGPFAALAAATVIQICAGLTYSFGAYSEDLRKVFGGSEKNVALLGTVKDAGAYFGLPGGALFDRFGASVTLLVGAVAHTLGFLGVYGVLVKRGPFSEERQKSASLPYASFAVFVSSNGNSLFDTAALLACMRFFPEDKAAVAGVLKAYLGLSSAVFQQMYATFVPVSGYDGGGGDGDGDGDGNRAARFVLLVAFVGGAVAVMGAPFFLVRDTPVSVVENAVWTTRERRKRTSAVLSRLNRLVIFLVVVVSAAAAANDPSVAGVAAPPLWVNGAFTAVVFALLLAPFFNVFYRSRRDARGEDVEVDARLDTRAVESDDSTTAPLLFSPTGAETHGAREEGGETSAVGEARASTLDQPPPPLIGQKRVDLTLLESFRAPEQWLLFATISGSSGAAMALVNNLDQVSSAVGSNEAASSALVSVFSVCNCLGRLIGGEASEFLFRRFRVARVTCLAAAQVAVALGVAIAASNPTPFGVFVAVATVGGALGAHWGALPTLTAELFGSKHVGAIYGWLSVSPMIGSYVLSTRVFGDAYDEATRRQNDARSSETFASCLGSACFRNAFLTGAAAALASAAVTCFLAARCKHVYSHLRGKLALTE